MTAQGSEYSRDAQSVKTMVPRHGDTQQRLIRAVAVIDAISIWSGKAFSYLIIPMVGSEVFEIISRYFFNRPTIWAEDMSTMIYGAFFMLGAGYTLQRQQHIRTDFLYMKWSTRTKGIVDSLLYITLYFPSMGIFLWVCWQYAFQSMTLGERIVTSPWMPIVWPLKLTMPIGAALLILQGVSEVVKCLYAAKTGTDLHGETEDVET
jgi:TRAP-type mannitol/chloroaromatic compound transport system permease small subunit